MKLTLVELFCSLRSQLVLAREQEIMSDLERLSSVFTFIGDVANTIQDKVISALAEDLENAARDSLMGVSWKSTILSEENLRRILSDHHS
jgi:hypothetical protein